MAITFNCAGIFGGLLVETSLLSRGISFLLVGVGEVFFDPPLLVRTDLQDFLTVQFTLEKVSTNCPQYILQFHIFYKIKKSFSVVIVNVK